MSACNCSLNSAIKSSVASPTSQLPNRSESAHRLRPMCGSMTSKYVIPLWTGLVSDRSVLRSCQDYNHILRRKSPGLHLIVKLVDHLVLGARKHDLGALIPSGEGAARHDPALLRHACMFVGSRA